MAALPLVLADPLAAAHPHGLPGQAAPDNGPAMEDEVPLDVVILADESGSLTEADVAAEAEAAAMIGQGILNPGSRLAVVGFGSDNGEEGQIAAREACPPTFLEEGRGRDAVIDCVDDLRARTEEEGFDTDHVAALQKAQEYFADDEAPEGAAKVVFLLTDGVLDVGNSPQYGETPQVRQRTALAALEGELERAENEEVQIWPLGFGDEIDENQLDDFAEDGYQGGCNAMPGAVPQARTVEDSTEILLSLVDALASASCLGHEQVPDIEIGSGETVEIPVDIPPVATEGAILVAKNNPDIAVEYEDPQGEVVPLEGDRDGSEFSHSGTNATVEVLRIGNPRAGDWTVRLTAPEGAEDELVAISTLWQGSIRSHLTVEGDRTPGAQELVVRLQLHTRQGNLDDVDVDAVLDILVELVDEEADGDPLRIDLADDGADPDREAGDGELAGTVEVAGEDGDCVEVRSRVEGEGISSEESAFNWCIGEQEDAVWAAARFDDPPEAVEPGEAIEGVLDVENSTGQDAEVQLVVEGSEGLQYDVEQDRTAFEPGSTSVPVRLRVDTDTDPGDVSFHGIHAADEHDEALGGIASPINFEVRPPPGPFERFWWVWALVLLLVTAVILYAAHRRSVAQRLADVRGLVVQLRRDGRPVGPELKALSRRSDTFAFTVLDGPEPRLDYAADPRQPHHTVRRHPPYEVLLRDPEGREQRVRLDTTSEPPAPGALSLYVRDERRSARTAPSPADPVAGGRPGPNPRPPWGSHDHGSGGRHPWE
ncbi:vWA domain-containing protein [Nocardiopsis nanhaiensis]